MMSQFLSELQVQQIKMPTNNYFITNLPKSFEFYFCLRWYVSDDAFCYLCSLIHLKTTANSLWSRQLKFRKHRSCYLYKCGSIFSLLVSFLWRKTALVIHNRAKSKVLHYTSNLSCYLLLSGLLFLMIALFWFSLRKASTELNNKRQG